MSKSWKDSLLASGLPLENDVKEYLRSKGCLPHFEYSYLRPDEHEIERQFSYDIDAAYIRKNQFVSLMVECKYRNPATKWIFLPDSCEGHRELSPIDFMHAIDHFVALHFPYVSTFPRYLAPACSKGVELAGDERNQKSINQALSQLAYAMAPKIADSIENQVERSLVHDHIFYHIPIIVTTAKVFRINDRATMKDIRETNSLEKIASEEEILVLNYTAGIDLKTYNWNVFNTLRQRIGDSKLTERMQTFTESIDHLFSVFSDYYAPRAIVILSVSNGWQAFRHLFKYIDEVLDPSEELLKEISEHEIEIDRQIDEMGVFCSRTNCKKRTSLHKGNIKTH